MPKNLFSSLANMSLYKEEVPDASTPAKGLAHSILDAIRKTLSASSISYPETLRETEASEPEEKMTDNMANYDMEEAIRRSILDAQLKRKGAEFPSEIELEQFYNCCERNICDDEGSSSGRMTPSSGQLSLQPSSSSGITYEDLYPMSSNELK